MLKKLKVKNFAIIEDVEIDFDKGMTVLTGQTGAGKSLLIDSISLLLGSRADTDMIRFGSNEAYIMALFEYNNKEIDELLSNFNIKKEDNIKIERTISKQKSYIKINNSQVNLQFLNQVTSLLADLHSQTDTFRLFNKDTYLSFLDRKDDIKFNNLLNDYLLEKTKYIDQFNKLEEILKKSKESKNNLDYLEHAYKEISQYNLYSGLDKEIEEKISKMKNFDKIFSNLKEGYNLLNNEYFNLDNLYDAAEHLNNIKAYDESYNEYKDKLEQAYSLSSEALEGIKSNLENLDFNPVELDELNQNLNEIENLELKYHKNFDELIKYQDELKLEIDLSKNYDDVIIKEENKLKKLFEQTLAKANLVSEYRKQLAKSISLEIVKECLDLELNHTQFEIRFEDIDTSNYHNKDIFKDNGIDNIDFYISLNLGEPLLPLSKVASGGEMSRIMLAFKSYFARRSNLELMVFDEIDTGVSGKVASEIAKKMYQISNHLQVLCITHLPQVASIADNQLYIYKEEVDGRTITKVKKLDLDNRIMEIAKMISGNTITSFAIEAAKEMIKK